MVRAVTMKDVAAAAGVSVMTVSRAFKADASVQSETRDRILQIADQLGYVFDRHAAGLRSQKTGFVAVTIPSINNANFSETVVALSAELAQAGLQVLLGNTNYDVEEEERLVAQFLGRRPETVVLTGGRHTERTRRRLASAGVPVVETWDLPDAPLGHVVGFSNAQAMAPLVTHLAEQGRRRIAFLGGDQSGDTRGADRRRGFVAAMEAAGLEPILFGGHAPPLTMRTGAHAMAALLAVHPEIDAVVGVSDLAAFGALTECQRRGIAVPDHIAIAGFGNYEISEVCVPALTTVDPFPARIGQAAGALVARLLAGEASAAPQIQTFVPQIRIRASTCP